MSFKGVCSDFPQNSVRDAICPRFSDNMYENFDFPTVGENVFRNRKAINRPLAGRNRRRRGTCGFVIIKSGPMLRSIRNGYCNKMSE
jgi:hypothetical protein